MKRRWKAVGTDHRSRRMEANMARRYGQAPRCRGLRMSVIHAPVVGEPLRLSTSRSTSQSRAEPKEIGGCRCKPE